MITIRNLDKWYGSTQALKDCSLHVAAGQVVVVCGPPAAGKSTLIKCIHGSESFERGEVIIADPLLGSGKTGLRRQPRRPGLVAPYFDLFPHLTVLRNVMLACRAPRRGRQERIAISMHLLDRVGLVGHARAYPGELSAAQQKRVTIARVLAMNPIAVLFDEPTAASQSEIDGELLDLIVGLAKDGMTMMVITADLRFARAVADRVIFMDRGEILEDASTIDFLEQPRCESARLFLSTIPSR